jgi:hypothetical protein
MLRFSRPSLRTAAANTSQLLAAACLAAALPLFSTPAAAQGNNCRGIAGLPLVITGYDFVYVSRSLAQGANGRVINCVRNRNANRGVFIDWKGSFLMSLVPAGGQIFTERPLGRTPRGEVYPLFYGARPMRLDVATMVELDPRPSAPAGHPLLVRAAWQERFDNPDAPVTVPGEMPVGANASQVYLPVVTDQLRQFVAHNPSRSALIEFLEGNATQLQPFAMTFDSRAAPSGANLTITYEVHYRLPAIAGSGPPALFLRFSDPELQGRLFGSSAPVPIAGSGGGETVLRASLTIPRARVASRAARLEVLLGNGAVVAALPVSYAVQG